MEINFLKEFREGKIAVHCRTEEEAIKLFECLYNNNIKWANGDSERQTEWKFYRENTSYSMYHGSLGYAPTDWHARRGMDMTNCKNLKL